jgi:fatty acid kinase fatty acid binding subunit
VSVAVVTDTCHYLPKELLAERGISEVSLYVHRNGKAERESEIVNYDDYYAELGSAKQLPTTSQPSIGDFLEVYEPLLKNHDEIVSIHLAGGMSGTVSSAQQAAERLGTRVHVLDSASACGGEGLVVLAAAAAARDGADGAAVAERARAARAELSLWFAIDTLEFLRRGGRIAGAQAWLGSALQIKPILTVEDEITPIERVRTSKRAFERLVGLLEDCRERGRDAWVVQHIQAPDQAKELVRRGREIFDSEPTFVSEIGPVIGTHVGPGLLGAGGVPQSLM